MKTKISKHYISLTAGLLLVIVGSVLCAWIAGAFDGEEPYLGTSDSLALGICAERTNIVERKAVIDNYRKQISDYMRTHSVIDNGFDLLARYDHSLRAEYDSLTKADSILNIYPTPPIADVLRLLPSNVNILHDWTDSKTDSIASAERNMIGEACGMGSRVYNDSTYYCGEYVNGRRHGLGFAISTDSRMRIGEWKRDKYLGECITYSEERIYGIDISRYQHEKGRKRFSIDWKNLMITSLGKLSKKNIHGTVNYPISFIYIKSTEGTTVFNRYYTKDYVNARTAGYRAGAYHFFSTKSSGAKQAMFFCKRSSYHKGDLPPVLDVEPSHAQIKKMGGSQVMFREIRAWLNYVEATWHVRPVLYVSQSFVNKYLPSAPDLMKRYNVWIARYGEYKPDVNLAFWQLSPDGRVQGIHTEVDINVFNGFEEDFLNF